MSDGKNLYVLKQPNDSSKKMPNPTKSFHKWLIIWAAVNTAALIIGTYIFTGTFLGFEL